MKLKKFTKPIFYGLLFILFYLFNIFGVLNNNSMRYLLQIFLYITLGEMWNLLSGYAGMTSLGQQAFIGLAGYSVAVATTTYKLHFSVGVLIGAMVSIVVAFLLAMLLLNMRGVYFSITTLVIAEALGTYFLSWKYVNQGAGMNISIVPYPRIRELYLFALLLCGFSLFVTYSFLKTKVGLGLTAMRDDVSAAASLGVNIRKHKFVVYLTAALFTSLAGAVFFINKGTIYPESGFDMSWTISMVFIVIIGGVGTVEGPIAGAIIYVLLSEYLAHFPGWSNIILGVICILIILFMPEGVVGFAKKVWKKIKAMYFRRKENVCPE